MLCSLCRSEQLNPSISVTKETVPQAIQIKQVPKKTFHLITAVFIQEFKVRRPESHKTRELGKGAQLLLLFTKSYPSYFFHEAQHDAGRAPHQHPGPLLRRPWWKAESQPACKPLFLCSAVQQILMPYFPYWKTSNKSKARRDFVASKVNLKSCFMLKEEVVWSVVLWVDTRRYQTHTLRKAKELCSHLLQHTSRSQVH